MEKIVELYEKYILAKSRVTFFNWLQGEYEDIEELLSEINCDLVNLKKICKNFK